MNTLEFVVFGLLSAVADGSRPATPADTAQIFAADATRGRQIAFQGTSSGVQACASCHSATGPARRQGEFRHLGGLNQTYLYRQLHNFRNGVRVHATMQPIAKAMSEQNIRDVAAYYATLRPASGARPPLPPR